MNMYTVRPQDDDSYTPAVLFRTMERAQEIANELSTKGEKWVAEKVEARPQEYVGKKGTVVGMLPNRKWALPK